MKLKCVGQLPSVEPLENKTLAEFYLIAIYMFSVIPKTLKMVPTAPLMPDNKRESGVKIGCIDQEKGAAHT